MSTPTLIRVTLNLAHPGVRRDLGDAGNMHRTVMSLAPDHLGAAPRQKAGMLYRVEETTRAVTLLVQSSAPVDVRELPPGYGQIETRNLTGLFTHLREGLLVQYRIAANPVRAVRDPDTPSKRGAGLPRGKPKAIYGEEAISWWTRRAHAAGLEIHTAQATRARAARSGNRTGLLHVLTRFDGLATVTDSERLTQAILHGVGKGKSFGAGLLSLAPGHPA